jgi:Flp pilus assembly protein TadG
MCDVPFMKRIIHRLDPRQLLRREDGSATVETVLWLPLFFAAFGLMTDAAMVFNGHSRVTRILQDANRNLSVGRFVDETETQSYILTALNALAPNATASTTITAGVATSVVQVPATDLEILGMFSALNSLTLTITSQQYLEF